MVNRIVIRQDNAYDDGEQTMNQRAIALKENVITMPMPISISIIPNCDVCLLCRCQVLESH